MPKPVPKPAATKTVLVCTIKCKKACSGSAGRGERAGWRGRGGSPSPPERARWCARLGGYDQVQEGLQWVGVPVIAGRLTADQMFAIADIAQELASGEIRPPAAPGLSILKRSG